MSTNRQPPYRTDVLVTILGLIGALIFFLVYDQAFPSAALDLKLTRQEALERGGLALQDTGFDTSGYISAVSFSGGGWASRYLQQTLGIPETNRRLQSEDLPLWHWYGRWYRPLQKEEYSVSLSPRGRVYGFSHTIEEDAPGAALEQPAAREIAEAYLTKNQAWKADEWEEVAASSSTQSSGRVDHYFSWKRRDFKAGEAELRIAMSVQGDQLGSYSYWIKVPEDFTRHAAEQQNRANLIDSLSSLIVITGLTFIGVLAFVLSLFRHALPRRSAYRVAVLVGVVGFLAALNALVLYKISYSTTESYAQFWFETIFYMPISAAITTVYIFILWSGGERLGKLAWPRQERLLLASANNHLSDRPASLGYIPPEGWMALARSTWRGLMMAGILGGYVVLFYLVATRIFGSWVPMDIGYTNLYSTPFPFMGPLINGLEPAVTEEVLVRLIGTAVFFALTRRKWLAVTIPGVLWGLAHMSYVRDPYYLRGIELSIPAILIFGVFFLKFDLTTTIIGHMTYNAMLGALPMLRSDEPYFVFSGLVVVAALLSPLLPGLWHGWRLRRRPADPDPQLFPAGEADLPALQTLDNRVDWQAAVENPGAVVVCLKSGEQLSGAATGRLDGEQGWLENVVVHARWRERYCGTRLAEAVVAGLQERGAQTVRISVPVRQRLALAFVCGMGWRTQAEVLTFGPAPTFTTWLRDFNPRKKAS